ncbi:type IV secretory system conjugative DNA transfer family protein [Pseudonocardia oroxyli]|uniref:Type IV secretory pathway, VirD4 component, TraG/TraD family ATPase n=1 Tax=Pseudonocardia oroxyli TaxID=366584 RepID=A0A1G7Z236_PSEOR|nr:type IV secretory system conjugative DNA transfer family protein [Pseudonocardia oroxyli]SDH02831.1 Type IV secretory pathway, VirD4 component, TraG/TraD family ATPase [Pseudonocardia oroxyli]
MLTVSLLVCGLLGGALLAWRRGSRGMASALGLLAVLPGAGLLQTLAWPAVALFGAAVLALVAHRWTRSAAVVSRWGARSRRKVGVASTLDIARVASGRAMRRKASTVRPTLTGRSRAADVAVQLCRTGWLRVWASIEDVVMVFGGPRSGKSGWLAGRVLDAAGAVLVTSTRTDLYTLTAPIRAATGPVHVFNAVGLGDHPSTITFDPLTGCTDAVTAAERATDMLGATPRGGGDREFWDAQARRILAGLLHAAALGDRRMRDVLEWVADPERAQREVSGLLRQSEDPAFEQDLNQFVTTNDRTRTSITSTIMPALSWLTSPAASAAAEPGGFDVRELLETRASIYLLGAEESHAAPLICALTGHIAREARRLAAREPSGRLDPPLTLALDEAALISPVPLQSWTADMGGRGVTILAAFQSRAQLLARWGEYDAATILNNTGAVMVFGGTRDRDDLQFWSTLTGERDEPVTTTDLYGRGASRSVRKVPVLAPAQIANLPAGRVLVIRRGIPPVIGRAQMAWRRRDVRAHQRARARLDSAARWRERLDVATEWRDDVVERVLVRLARRWPDRFEDPARRVTDANRMFRELREIRRHPELVKEEP